MIYLDNAATSFPKPAAVIEKVQETMLYAGANPGRGGHRPALCAGRLVDRARRGLAALLQVEDEADIFFGFNCTDMLNAALYGVVEPGWEVACTVWEHNSVLRPLHEMQRRGLITLKIGEDLEQAITGNTRLAVVSHASNVTGAVQPVEALAALCRQRGILLLVDAAQTAGVLPLYPERWGVDMVAMPGHKGLLGPMGTGALYARKGLKLTVYRQGGTGTASLSPLQPEERPEGMESGTLNAPGLAGLSAGVDYVLKRRAAIQAHEQLLTRLLLEGLSQLPQARVLGPQTALERVGTVSLNLGELPSGLVADGLAQRDICVRAGLHCAPLAHRALGTTEQGAVRVSFGPFNTAGDVWALLEALKDITREAGI